mgnify:CR=1 FL=1
MSEAEALLRIYSYRDLTNSSPPIMLIVKHTNNKQGLSMSAGEFTSSKYESNSGSIYKIRVQDETLSATIGAVANTAPIAAVDQEVSAKASGGKREIGMIARTVTLRFTGTLPTGYSGDDVTVPVMQSSTFDSWTTPADQTGTYQGVAVTLVGQSAERKR